MRKQIIRDYGNILKNINTESLNYIDFLSKSIGVRDTMLIVFAVESVKIMQHEMHLGATLGVRSFDIDELTNNFLVAKLFLRDYVCEKKIIKEVDVKNFQNNLKDKVNSHVINKKDKLFDMALKLFDKPAILKYFQSNSKDKVNSHVINKKDKLFDMALKLFDKSSLQRDGEHFLQDTVIKNIATDFYREINSEDLDLKKEVLEILHKILIDNQNQNQNKN